MVDRINNLPGVERANQNPPRTSGAPANGKGFAATLAHETQQQEALRVSSHARKRLDSSQVTLTDSHLARLDGAVARATQKGSNQSLIMLDDLALVVSVKNRVVITAVDGPRMKEGVFTNIDSVVIA
ncbi:MAG: TIGR02530 family flagellar biosynthesis protein [Armatimonadota bacterium]|nr:TIGR02530 family flagellar biosynthesis protein [Armatimonadota bacterium]